MTAPARNLHRVWQALALIDAILLLAVSTIVVPEAAARVPYLDKAAHIGEYWLFALVLAQAMAGSPRRFRNAWLAATAYGAMIELLQAVLPWRSADLADALANVLGAALGIWTAQRFLNTPHPEPRTPHS